MSEIPSPGGPESEPREAAPLAPEAADTASKMLGEEMAHYRMPHGASDIIKGNPEIAVGMMMAGRPEGRETPTIGEKLLADVTINKAGMLRTHETWPGTGEPTFFDATRVSADMFGNIHSVGEMITETEMQRRLKERQEQRKAAQEARHGTGARKDEDDDVEVTVIQEGQERQGLMKFNPATFKYSLVASK